MSCAKTLSSMLSIYEKLGSLENEALKSNNNSNSLANLSNISLPDIAYSISQICCDLTCNLPIYPDTLFETIMVIFPPKRKEFPCLPME